MCCLRAHERRPDVLHLQQVDAHIPAELVRRVAAALAALLEPVHVAVESRRPLHVCDRDGDEIRPLDDQPTEPSIWSWISRFISTAYSSGSSFVIGSTKPETIIADASASESPRDIR